MRILLVLLCVTSSLAGGRTAVATYIREHPRPRMVLASEGKFIGVFQPGVERWIREPLELGQVRRIEAALAPRLAVDLTARGFAQAATRDTGAKPDETHYDAIWVRDSVWICYALRDQPARQADARRLILALWDYYATPHQLDRFRNIIAHPERSTDPMAMPHIRFDGNSKQLGDVMVNGHPESWNHRQLDAHGLFFTCLGECVASGLVTAADLGNARARVLACYPLFLRRIRFESYEDAGAWEELPRRNTSSIGLVTRSLQIWQGLETVSEARAFLQRFRTLLSREGPAVRAEWEPAMLAAQERAGLALVHRQLYLGGESPDYAPGDVHFRRADAALLALLAPSPLAGLSAEEQRKVLLIVETLSRPLGILRYEEDSYQCGNYWIRPPAPAGAPTLTGDSSAPGAFLARLAGLLPGTEAQWFFDSWMALAHLHLARTTRDRRLAAQDLSQARLHIKRALGQLTGVAALAADGLPVGSWQAPESINTVVQNGQTAWLSSPIAPLNWAKATLGMSLRALRRALEEPTAP